MSPEMGKKIKLLKFIINFIDHLTKITLTRTFNSIQVDHGKQTDHDESSMTGLEVQIKLQLQCQMQ